jgi:hypothetical protein
MARVPGPSDESSLRDWATKRKEGVGMPSYFSDSTHMIPPLVDIPQELVSSIVHGGLAAQGGHQPGRGCSGIVTLDLGRVSNCHMLVVLQRQKLCMIGGEEEEQEASLTGNTCKRAFVCEETKVAGSHTFVQFPNYHQLD